VEPKPLKFGIVPIEMIPDGNAKQIMDSAMWGAEPALKASATAELVASSAKASDLDDLGKSMVHLMDAARGYDPKNWRANGILGAFVKNFTAHQLDAYIRSVNAIVDGLIADCKGRIAKVNTRNDQLAAMYDDNWANFYALGDAAVMGSRQVIWAKANAPIVSDADPRSAQEAAKWQSAITSADKRIDDLGRHKLLCQLMAPQIEQMRDNGRLIVLGLQRAIELTIPALRIQYSLYVVQREQKKNADQVDAIDADFEKAIKANAAAAHVNAVQINTAMARSAVSIETLTTVTNELVNTISDVAKIRSDMTARLAAEAPQIAALSAQLAARQAQG
jgi:uncharacterized protein YaaN involved in tellurite resistance